MLNDEVFNGTPKTLIPYDGVLNYNGVLKSNGKPKEDHVTHFWGWIEIFIAPSSIWKCSYAKDTMEGRLMMRMSSTTDGNKQ